MRHPRGVGIPSGVFPSGGLIYRIAHAKGRPRFGPSFIASGHTAYCCGAAAGGAELVTEVLTDGAAMSSALIRSPI